MAGFVDWIPRLFLLGALFGAIGCLGRADYNLPVFLFAYIAWIYMQVHSLESKNKRYSLVYLFNTHRHSLVDRHRLAHLVFGCL